MTQLMVIAQPEPEEVELKDRTVEESQARGQIEQLERYIAAVSTELGNCVAAIQKMETELQESFRKEVDELDALNQEMQELLKEIALKALEEQVHSGVDEDNSTERFKSYQGEDQEESNVRRRDKAVEQVFRRIAMKTHPDRNKNKSQQEKDILHELWLEAKTAYEQNDLQGLLEIEKCVKELRTRKLNQLIAKVVALTNQMLTLQANLNNMKHSPSYLMMKDYEEERNHAHVKNHYSRLLAMKKESMLNQIRALDPTRYPVPPAPPTPTYAQTSVIITSTGAGWSEWKTI